MLPLDLNVSDILSRVVLKQLVMTDYDHSMDLERLDARLWDDSIADGHPNLIKRTIVVLVEGD